jgi:hypothetical protein
MICSITFLFFGVFQLTAVPDLPNTIDCGVSVYALSEEAQYARDGFIYAPETWLHGRKPSFTGGEETSSEEQLTWAEKHGYRRFHSQHDYDKKIAADELVRLRHPNVALVLRASERPHVLPSTAAVAYEIAEEFLAVRCGVLQVTSASRLTTSRNGTIHSLHPAGFAIDLRVNGLSQRCLEFLQLTLLEKERAGRIDATQEFQPPHMHVVVIPPVIVDN